MNNDIVKPPQETSKQKVVDGIVPAPQAAKSDSSPQVEENTEKSADVNSETPPEKQEVDQTAKRPKKKTLKLPIILALIVLSALAGLAIYIGFFADDVSKNENKSEGTSQTADNSVEQNKQEAADIVNQINDLQDDTDTSGDGLTDQNLGL